MSPPSPPPLPSWRKCLVRGRLPLPPLWQAAISPPPTGTQSLPSALPSTAFTRIGHPPLASAQPLPSGLPFLQGSWEVMGGGYGCTGDGVMAEGCPCPPLVMALTIIRTLRNNYSVHLFYNLLSVDARIDLMFSTTICTVLYHTKIMERYQEYTILKTPKGEKTISSTWYVMHQ